MQPFPSVGHHGLCNSGRFFKGELGNFVRWNWGKKHGAITWDDQLCQGIIGIVLSILGTVLDSRIFVRKRPHILVNDHMIKS